MQRLMKSILAASAAVGLVLPTVSAIPEAHSAPMSNRVKIVYATPAEPAYRPMYEMLKKRRILEKFRNLLSIFRLPDRLTLRVSDCEGDINARYDHDTHIVTVCYEYIEDFQRRAPKETTTGVTPEDAVIGPVVEVFLHEISHAVLDMLKIPILGRWEDAADQLATYIMLGLGKDFAKRTVLGAAWMRAQYAKEETPGKADYSDAHSLDAQRFYNCLCLAYGSDPELFAAVVEKGYLPRERAEGCTDEYQQVEYAARKLLSPHVDKDKLKKARATGWFRPAANE